MADAPVFHQVYETGQLNIALLAAPLFGLYCVKQAFSKNSTVGQMFMLNSASARLMHRVVFGGFALALAAVTFPYAAANLGDYLMVRQAEQAGTVQTVAGKAQQVTANGFCVNDICVGYEGSIDSLSEGVMVRADYIGKKLVRLDLPQ
ncbi:MAG: hypothetical protein PW788_10020 [Micavibrio sp.]|nr:hypothetical protein [Micavibrio sp.]